MDGTAHIITLDFETPYSTDYSLSKLTYEDYIYDPRFKPHGVGIKIDNRPTRYYKNNIRGVLAGLFTPGNQHTLICHNAMFDGAVLSWHYGLTAGKYYCTERLSKALWHAGSASLGALAKRLFPDDTSKRKGDELVQFKSRFSLTDEEQHTLGLYCCNDVELTYECFRVMYPFVPAEELEVLSLTLRMFIEPSLVLDRDAVEVYLKDLETDKAQVIQASGLDKKLLASNDQFAAWIQAQGIPFSQIPSPTPKNKANMKWPLSKNAPEFIALQANYPQYNPMWDARIAVKSTQEVTRARRLLAHSARTGRIAMPLNYAAAHTLRWGGTNRINPQNFGQDSKLRPALLAPPGYQVMVIDLKNIEMRLLAWLAGETLILDALKQGKDLYREFAAEVFRKPVEYVTGLERFIGKTCILGLGYYMGHNKLHLQLATGKQRVNFTLDECKTFVQAYRRKYRRITRLWELADGWCRKMCEPTTNENYKCLTIEPGRIGFPSGMYLNFPTIKAEWGPHEQFDGITYWNGKHRTDLYSGKLVENIIQRLARDVIRDYLLQVDAYLLPNGGRVVLQVHDEIVALVPEDLAITAYDHASAIMRQPPAFCADGSLVLDVDGGCARNYAKAA